MVKWNLLNKLEFEEQLDNIAKEKKEMVAFIGVISFFGLLACIVMTISNAIRKKPVKPVAIGIAVCFVLFVVCLAITPPIENNQQADNKEPTESEQIITSKEEETTTSNTEESENILEESSQYVNDDSEEPSESKELVVEEESTQSEEVTDAISYDKLQSLFLAFSFKTTEDDLIKWIEDNNLEYTAKKYNGTPKTIQYKIAYEPDVALQKYAESGDCIEISFNIADGSFMYAKYFNNNTFKSALLYNYGTYYDFRENEGNNKYSGYYYHKPGDDEGGITIEYNNGNSTETGYHSTENGEDALSGVLD